MYRFWTFDLFYYRTEGIFEMPIYSVDVMEKLINVFMLDRFFLFPFVYFLFCTAVFSTIQVNYILFYLPTCMSHFNVFRLLFFFTLCFLLLFFLLGNYILCLTYRFTLHYFYHGEVNQCIHGRELNFRFYRIEPCVVCSLQKALQTVMGLAWSGPSASPTACLLHLA